ncbi:MAG TPA: hypothetical protein VGJ28_26665 [Micromonosporaceae bacterium]|jgi:hypothetical protein
MNARILVPICLFGLLLGGVACTSAARTPSAAAATCSPAPPASVSPSLPPGAVDQLGFINDLGVDRFSDTYTWTTSPYAGTFIVSETRKRPDFVAAIHRLKGDADIVVIEKIVPRSIAGLRALADRVANDRKALADAGVTIVSTDGDPVTDRTEVEVTLKGCDSNTVIPATTLRKMQAVFDTRYGKGLVYVSPIVAGQPELV